MQFSDSYEDSTLRDKFGNKLDRWRTRKVRQTWMDYEKSEKAMREELAQTLAPLPAIEPSDPALPESV